MASTIETRDLTKYYGRMRGIEGLTLEVAQGEVFGFLGPNGAGKTTTIRLLLDLLHPTRGRVAVLGMDPRRHSLEVRRRIGYIPGEVAFYGELTGMAFLELKLSFWKSAVNSRLRSLTERLELDLGRKIRTYSSGTRQKLALLQSLLPDPELLILDEPTLGLDPLMQQEFYRIVAEEQGRDKTIFLSSHILPEVERVCGRVGIVRQGRLVAVEAVAELKRKKVRRMELTFREPVPQDAFQLPGVEVVLHQGSRVELAVHGGVEELLRRLSSLPVEDLVFPEASLEDTFMKFYSGQGK